jgi:pantoate--beta-alanine ligase
MSSRNLRLSAEHRAAAPSIYKALQGIRERGNTWGIAETTDLAIKQIEATRVLSVEYLELADAASLETLTSWEQATGVVACTAVFAGEVRLIDNIVIV